MADTPADLDRAWDLSRRYDEHPISDIVYVTLAQRLGEPLYTVDQRVRDRLQPSGFVLAPSLPAPLPATTPRPRV